MSGQVFNRSMCGASLLRALGHDQEADAIVYALKELDRRPSTLEIKYPSCNESPRIASYESFLVRNVVPSVVVESDGWQVKMRCVVESGKWSDLTRIH